MSFIRSIDYPSSQGVLREIYDRIRGARGGVASLMSAQSLNPSALHAHFELYKALLFGRSELDRRTREMIGIVVSATNRCAYGVAHHQEPLRRYGVDESILEALAAGDIPYDVLSAPLVALLEYVRDLTATPASDKERIEALKADGWSDSAILDATMTAGYFNFLNRIALGLGIELEDEFADTCAPDWVEDVDATSA